MTRALVIGLDPFGAAAGTRMGKDTPSGHSELMGCPVDFDMLCGHRRDVAGHADALEAFDAFLTVPAWPCRRVNAAGETRPR